MAETEAVLLKRFTGSGDAQALAEIIRRHAGLVYGAALRILADVDRASDVAQETFLQLTKDAASVTGSLPGWLHRVATHKAIDQMRRDASRRHRERQYAAEERPHAAVEWKTISPYVDVGLRELEPELRKVLILHFLEGRTTREIALTQGAVPGDGVAADRGRGRTTPGQAPPTRRPGRRGALSALLGDNAVQAAPAAAAHRIGQDGDGRRGRLRRDGGRRLRTVRGRVGCSDGRKDEGRRGGRRRGPRRRLGRDLSRVDEALVRTGRTRPGGA